ncbi:MAG: hypothetical protein FWC08_13925 [Defluviitaleaceae bacterium]|nr:hypothetical protein [Defluviitaleaceae bacterium]
MVGSVLTRQSLPQALLDILQTEKVYLQENEGEIRISPLREGSGLLGIGVGSNLSTAKFSEYKREDLKKENRTFAQ